MSQHIPNDYDDRDGEDDGFLTDGESGYILDEELDSDYNWYNTIIGRVLLLFGYTRNDVVKQEYCTLGRLLYRVGVSVKYKALETFFNCSAIWWADTLAAAHSKTANEKAATG